MTSQHPITPPPELFKRWENDILTERENVDFILDSAWKHGYRTGADQELDACAKEVSYWSSRNLADRLRDCRRPRPPSLKEQALAALAEADGADYPVVCTTLTADQHALIRRALEQLDD